jgi:hypothetical protein
MAAMHFVAFGHLATGRQVGIRVAVKTTKLSQSVILQTSIDAAQLVRSL